MRSWNRLWSVLINWVSRSVWAEIDHLVLNQFYLINFSKKLNFYFLLHMNDALSL